MAKIAERRQSPPHRSWLTKIGDAAAVCWELTKKVGFFGIGAFILGLVVYDVSRECRFDGIVLENVVVKGASGDSGLGAEMASQQIATYIAGSSAPARAGGTRPRRGPSAQPVSISPRFRRSTSAWCARSPACSRTAAGPD
jgi:hypothetical protein